MARAVEMPRAVCGTWQRFLPRNVLCFRDESCPVQHFHDVLQVGRLVRSRLAPQPLFLQLPPDLSFGVEVEIPVHIFEAPSRKHRSEKRRVACRGNQSSMGSVRACAQPTFCFEICRESWACTAAAPTSCLLQMTNKRKAATPLPDATATTHTHTTGTGAGRARRGCAARQLGKNRTVLRLRQAW